MRGVLRSSAVFAAGAGLVLGATYLPSRVILAHEAAAAASSAQVEPVVVAQSICPGPEALGIAGLADPAAQKVSVTAAAAPVAVLPPGSPAGQGTGSLTISALGSGDALAAPVIVRGKVVFGAISTARPVLVSGVGAMAPGTVATQWSWTRSGDGRGLVTAACLPAATSSWLVAGGGQPGRLGRLVLTNPGPNPVTVDVSVLGAGGPIDSPNGHGVVVAGYGRTVLLLDAIAGSVLSPVVHVSTQGGEVAAVLSDSWLDGVVPRGGDDAVSVAVPAREQVIAGAAIQGAAVLRVGVPGDSEAVVQARVLTASGPQGLPSGAVTRVAGQATEDIDLSSLAPGDYAVQVSADVPVVAAVMLERRRAGGATSEMAWPVASLPIRTLAGMALPASADGGLTQRLDLAATQVPGSVLVTTVAADGRVATLGVSIGADSVSTLNLVGATSVWVSPRTGLVRAAVLTTARDAAGVLLSVTPLTDLTLTTASVPLRQLGD